MQTTYSPFFWPTTSESNVLFSRAICANGPLENIVKATEELHIPINDQATGKAFGGYFCPHNQDPKTETRSSAEEAYYASAKPRQNFHIITGHMVSRIVTESRNGTVKVTGVEFAQSADAKLQHTKVKREAVLAAGTLHTPQLLQVSGIGDASLHASINVSTVVDLPAVGHNLHDHLFVTVVHALNTSVLTNTLTTNATFAAQARQQYDDKRSGPLTSPTGDFLLFLPVKTYSNATQSILAQALEAGPSASLPSDTPAEVVRGYKAQFASLNKKLEADNSAFLEVIWADGVMVLGLQHPYSRGSLKAKSSSIFDAPVADAGFLRNGVDVALLREAVHFARRLAVTPAIASLNPFEAVPGANVTASADIDAFVRSSATTLYHPAGTCKMGPKEEGGVVDEQLKVYGVDNLRIVDASTIPILPASHTMTTVYAVAEKAADIIKGNGKGYGKSGYEV